MRGMLYDALSYADQVSEIRKNRKKDRTYGTPAEFLSGLNQTDQLFPIITIIFSREDAIDFAEAHNIPIPVTKEHDYSMDRNLSLIHI